MSTVSLVMRYNVAKVIMNFIVFVRSIFIVKVKLLDIHFQCILSVFSFLFFFVGSNFTIRDKWEGCGIQSC